MSLVSLHILRKTAPAVLAATLLFVAVSDAGATCLAAWLCPRPAQAECEHEGSGSVWRTASEHCTFESRVEPLSLKLDVVRLHLPSDTVSPFIASSSHVTAPSFHLGASPHPAGDGAPPLYVLQAALLI